MSNEVWFTSDTHFGHANILKFEAEARPFSTLEEMHEALIENWNSCVHPSDVVWHLGDFAFGAYNIPIAARLNGIKKLVLGNHDSYHISKYLPYFSGVHGVKNLGNGAILSHIPLRRDNFGGRNILNVHGHLHSKEVTLPCGAHDQEYFNVSVELHGLAPINLSVIKDRITQLRDVKKGA